jgi:hypothetical protein
LTKDCNGTPFPHNTVKSQATPYLDLMWTKWRSDRMISIILEHIDFSLHNTISYLVPSGLSATRPFLVAVPRDLSKTEVMLESQVRPCLTRLGKFLLYIISHLVRYSPSSDSSDRHSEAAVPRDLPTLATIRSREHFIWLVKVITISLTPQFLLLSNALNLYRCHEG